MDLHPISAALIEHLVGPVLTILGGIVLTLGAWVLERLRRRIGLEETDALEAHLEHLVDLGVAYAEQRAKVWAKVNDRPSPPEHKLQWALEWIASEAEDRGFVRVATEKLQRLIEARLGGTK